MAFSINRIRVYRVWYFGLVGHFHSAELAQEVAQEKGLFGSVDEVMVWQVKEKYIYDEDYQDVYPIWETNLIKMKKEVEEKINQEKILSGEFVDELMGEFAANMGIGKLWKF